MIKAIHGHFDSAAYMEIVHYGKHGILREMSGTISARISIFITAAYLSMSDLAILGVAGRYGMISLAINTAVQMKMFPEIVGFGHTAQDTRLANSVELTLSRLYLVLLIVVFVISLGAYHILYFLHGTEYTDGVYLVIGFTLLTLFNPVGATLGSVLNAINMPARNSRVVLVIGILNIFFSFIFIRGFGLKGAVMAPFLSESIGVVWSVFLLKKYIRFSSKNVVMNMPVQFVEALSSLRVLVKSKLTIIS